MGSNDEVDWCPCVGGLVRAYWEHVGFCEGQGGASYFLRGRSCPRNPSIKENLLGP